MLTKKCTKCEKVKKLKWFAKNAKRKDGYGTWCKRCLRTYYYIREGIPNLEYICSICDATKLRGEFRWNPKFGVRTECKKCEETQLRCSKCGEVKPYEGFPPSKQSATGRHGWCLECHSKRVNDKYHAEGSEDRKKRKERTRSERAKAWRKAYVSRPEVLARIERYKKERNARLRFRWHFNQVERTKHKARTHVAYMVKAGKLEKPKFCSECGELTELQAHHHLGYWPKAVWLQVQWLCIPCHNKADVAIRDSGREWFVLDGNPALVKVVKRLRRTMNMLGLNEDKFLEMVMSCGGNDEMDTIVNFTRWLRVNGFVIRKKVHGKRLCS